MSYTCNLHNIVHQLYINQSIKTTHKQTRKSGAFSVVFFSHIRFPSAPRCLFVSVSIYWAPTVSSELFQGSGEIRSLKSNWAEGIDWDSTNLRISEFGRGAGLWGKAVALGSTPGPPCSPGEHAVPWKELIVSTAWLRGRSRRGKDEARPARMKFLSLEPRGSRGIGRLSCALSSIHSWATYGDGSYAFYVY